VSENESFIDEVTEEVRRDKLYLLLKRYGWVPVIVIITVILTSIFIEIRDNAKVIEAENLGDLLASSLSGDTEVKAILSNDISSTPKSLIALLLEAKILENKLEYQTAIAAYQTVLSREEIPTSLRDFVKFKLVLLVKDDPIGVKKLIGDLINPDGSFYLLALEQKVLIEIGEKRWNEAIANLNLILADPDVSQGMISRATQIKKAIRLDSL
jgi:hypothetical protein